MVAKPEITWQSRRQAKYEHVPGGAGHYADRGMFTAFKALPQA